MSSSKNIIQVHFSSESVEWGTPQDLFDKLNSEFHFTTDVCATPENAKCKQFYTEYDDAFTKDWLGSCWMNPPYGRDIIYWMEKAYTESLKGATVVCLIPSRTDTKWWHEYVMKADEIRLVRGRLKFNGHKNSAPFPSAIAIFNSEGRVV